jgi:ribosome biogenesis GTPase
MKATDLGYTSKLEKYRVENGLTGFEAGRVVSEHKERYIVKTTEGEYESEVTGNLRFSARSRDDFPAVGDWVALAIHDDGFAIIHHILPRSSLVARQATGQFGEKQIIAANIDYALLLQAADMDFNINRLERYLTICYSSNVSPIIVLTKTDLAGGQRMAEMMESIRQRIHNIAISPISNKTL